MWHVNAWSGILIEKKCTPEDWKSMMHIRVNQSLIQILFSNNSLHTFPCKWHGQRNSCIFVSLATRSVCYLWAAWFFCCWKNHFWDVSYVKIFSPLIELITFMRQRIKNFSCLQRWCTSFWFRVIIWIVFSIGSWDIFQ